MEKHLPITVDEQECSAFPKVVESVRNLNEYDTLTPVNSPTSELSLPIFNLIFIFGRNCFLVEIENFLLFSVKI